MPTASGKTTTATAYLAAGALAQGKRVLWITKDWALLRQAAATARARIVGAGTFMGRIGGVAELPDLPEDASAQLVFTTIHTWWARRRKLESLKFSVVVVDEVHWGEDGPLYKALRCAYGRSATFVGLTATPRAWSGYETVYSVDFDTLAADGHLAKPEIESVTETGVIWRPSLSGSHGDFTPGSLKRLARSPKRNRCIVDTFLSGRDRYGKTLIFACNVEHAIKLTELMRQHGVPAECIHSRMSTRDQAGVLRRFAARRGEGGLGVEVLVNVAMMTHGVDIPDIKTVFLTRPTTSDILLVQMAGRGARVSEGKTTFNLVDFVDVLTAHGEKLRHAGDFLGAVRRTASKSRRSPSARAATFPYLPAPIQVYRARPGYEALDGLEIQPHQSFGIEFELTREDFSPGILPPDWSAVAKRLLDAVRQVVGPSRCAKKPQAEHNAGTKDYSVWNVEPDVSCGWEITSRVLVGAEGFEEIHDVTKALEADAEKLKLIVNTNTGTHVHLGAGSPSAQFLQELYELVAAIEPALFSLVPPSRYGNMYCQSIRNVMPEIRRLGTLDKWRKWLDRDGRRYLQLNGTNIFSGTRTIEARLHGGTLEGPKILLWVALWMRILEAAGRHQSVADAATAPLRLPMVRGVHGDVVQVARLFGAGRELLKKLDRRRRHVVTHSWCVHPKFKRDATQLSQQWRRVA